ncbi:hypothetical protein THAOC_08392, partial [Thalassiosira oceanica]
AHLAGFVGRPAIADETAKRDRRCYRCPLRVLGDTTTNSGAGKEVVWVAHCEGAKEDQQQSGGRDAETILAQVGPHVAIQFLVTCSSVVERADFTDVVLEEFCDTPTSFLLVLSLPKESQIFILEEYDST